MKGYLQRNTKYGVSFLRLLVCVLFLPFFLLMDPYLPRQIYYLSGCTFLYACCFQIWPRMEAFINKFIPVTTGLDLVLISFFIYYAPNYGLPLGILYLFPITVVAFRNRLGPTFLITSLSGGLYLSVGILKTLPLKPLILEIVSLFILAFYLDLVTQHFHLTYFRQANQDSLTKIHNRRYFNFIMERLVQSNTPHSLIIMDLDNFKTLNDTQGHHHGDFVLKIVAGIIKECTRSSDIVTRFGGDEFAIILPQTPKEVSKEIADRIRNNVLVNPKLLTYSQISISQGIACYPTDAATIEGIIQKADSALYTAKSKGKNFVQLYEEQQPGLF